jgi:hypothetical protein
VSDWLYQTNTVAEAPFAWSPLFERYRLDRAISVQETAPGIYVEVRYTDYTDENGAINLPQYTAYQELQFNKSLHFFRGGYEHVVDDNVRADLIASGVATPSNFTPA